MNSADVDRTEQADVEVPNALAGQRLDRTVSMLFDISRERSGQLIDEGLVAINGRAVLKRSYRVHASEIVSSTIEAVGPSVPLLDTDPTDLDLVYFDGDLIVIDKRAGQVVHPGSGNTTGTISQGLVRLFPEVATVGAPGRTGIVHRLDKGTSGLMLLARSQSALTKLMRDIARREVQRTYLALVSGSVEFDEGDIDAPISRSIRDPLRMSVSAAGKSALTHFRVLDRMGEIDKYTLLELRLETGRTHQIRVHLQAVGHPVVGDPTYKGKRIDGLSRPFLHSSRISLTHPIDGHPLSFSSSLPFDLSSVLTAITSR